VGFDDGAIEGTGDDGTGDDGPGDVEGVPPPAGVELLVPLGAGDFAGVAVGGVDDDGTGVGVGVAEGPVPPAFGVTADCGTRGNGAAPPDPLHALIPKARPSAAKTRPCAKTRPQRSDIQASYRLAFFAAPRNADDARHFTGGVVRSCGVTQVVIVRRRCGAT
jgi:hypothetical protein